MQEIIGMLKAAAMDEHAAIIQYLTHAYAMGEGEEACEIEGIARDEMRHFWMLSRWIVKLGGVPTLERGFVDTEGNTPSEWMERDVEAESRAISMYTDYIAKIDDPDLRDDLERILHDEERHRGDFLHFVEKLKPMRPPSTQQTDEEPVSPAEVEPRPSPLPQTDRGALEWGVQHEYAALLQYLLRGFLIRDDEVARQSEMQAINEMQHMGWLAEALAEHGHDVPFEPHGVDLSEAPVDMLRADLTLEQDTAAKYEEFIKAVQVDEVRELLSTIREHELYHERLFSRLLKRLSRMAPGGWTIGSLTDEGE